jgi:hypothetical protein
MRPYQELEITKELIEKVKSIFIQVITIVKPVRSISIGLNFPFGNQTLTKSVQRNLQKQYQFGSCIRKQIGYY